MAVCATLVVVAGCGSGQPDELSAEGLKITNQIAHAQSKLSLYCVLRFEGGSPAAPTRQVDVLVGILRKYPDYKDDGTPLREEMRDLATNLDECGAPELARQIDRELEAQ